MAKVLVLFAHPRPDRSEINQPLFETAQAVQGVTCVDLYAQYPDFNIDVDAEQGRLVEHDVIIFQHPFYWYSAPSIMKEWQDLVLEYGFAYGHSGRKLTGKVFQNVISTGGRPETYTDGGLHHSDVRSLLAPFEKTANLCRMRYLAPLVLFGASHAIDENRLNVHRNAYDDLLKVLVADRLDLEKAMNVPALNDVLDDFILKEEAV
ncbi:MAG: NAD(P)H-dependent oxidoreductase [Roseibium sp.]